MINGIEIKGTISNEVDFNALKRMQYIKVKKYPDALYFGQVDPKTGKRHGIGIMKYKNKRVYEGHMLNDQRHGRGFERYPNKNTYVGLLSLIHI